MHVNLFVRVEFQTLHIKMEITLSIILLSVFITIVTIYIKDICRLINHCLRPTNPNPSITREELNRIDVTECRDICYSYVGVSFASQILTREEQWALTEAITNIHILFHRNRLCPGVSNLIPRHGATFLRGLITKTQVHTVFFNLQSNQNFIILYESTDPNYSNRVYCILVGTHPFGLQSDYQVWKPDIYIDLVVGNHPPENMMNIDGHDGSFMFGSILRHGGIVGISRRIIGGCGARVRLYFNNHQLYVFQILGGNVIRHEVNRMEIFDIVFKLNKDW